MQRLFCLLEQERRGKLSNFRKVIFYLDSYDIIQLYIVTELTDGRVSDRLFSVSYTPKENIKNPGEFIVFSAWYAAKALEMDVK